MSFSLRTKNMPEQWSSERNYHDQLTLYFVPIIMHTRTWRQNQVWPLSLRTSYHYLYRDFSSLRTMSVAERIVFFEVNNLLIPSLPNISSFVFLVIQFNIYTIHLRNFVLMRHFNAPDIIAPKESFSYPWLGQLNKFAFPQRNSNEGFKWIVLKPDKVSFKTLNFLPNTETCPCCTQPIKKLNNLNTLIRAPWKKGTDCGIHSFLRGMLNGPRPHLFFTEYPILLRVLCKCKTLTARIKGRSRAKVLFYHVFVQKERFVHFWTLINCFQGVFLILLGIFPGKWGSDFSESILCDNWSLRYTCEPFCEEMVFLWGTWRIKGRIRFI